MACRVCGKEPDKPLIVEVGWTGIPTHFCDRDCWNEFAAGRHLYNKEIPVIVGRHSDDVRAHFYQAHPSLGGKVESLCHDSVVPLLEVERSENVTCDVCAITLEGELDLEDVKLSGQEPEMDSVEYRRLFNLARTSKDLTTELVSDLEKLKVTGKSFAEMTMEEKADHIEFLNRMMRKVKVFKNSAALQKQEELMQLSEAEREKVRQYDRKYKPKPRATEEGTEKRSSGERKAAQSPEEKLLDQLTKMLGSREAAEKYIASQKAGGK